VLSAGFHTQEAKMTTLPHGVADLYLAPVVLAFDARLEELARLSIDELAGRVALESDLAAWTPELRRAGLLRTIEHLIDSHGWTVSWDVRGLRLTHGPNSLVLGVPETFDCYVIGVAAPV
jgi:hypothetical protein